MLKKLTTRQSKMIEEIIARMTLADKAAQVLCWNIRQENMTDIKDIITQYHLGAVFIGSCNPKRLKEIQAAIKTTGVPIIVAGDLEHGAGAVVKGAVEFPLPMAASATDDATLIKTMGLATAAEGRFRGFHWTFAPVVDLSLNYNNPVTGTRALGDNPNQVIKMVKPYIAGLQKGGRLAACCKHFPGDGVDDRDQHFCTSVNSLSKAQWFKSYGKIWREVIAAGTMSIMAGHIALPFQDEEKNYLGPPPATLSKKIQVDLLRKELGFEGLIVSDAISMVGINAHLKPDEVAVQNIAAGSDMVLFANPANDSTNILNALQNGTISQERLDDAVKHVLELKARVGLLDDVTFPVPSRQEIAAYKQSAQTIADKSVTIIRNSHNLLPLKELKKGDKVLTVTIGYMGKGSRKRDLEVIDLELKKRGLEVTHLVNPTYYQLINICGNYKAVFINLAILPHSMVGTTRMTGDLLMSFWRAFWVSFDHVVFTSFGSPYHLHELPSIPNYINLYSNTAVSQKAAVKFWLGEITARGQSPVKIKETSYE